MDVPIAAGVQDDDGFTRSAQGQRSIAHKEHGAFGEHQWTEPFAFVQLADTQLGMLETFDVPNRSGWEQERHLFDLAIAEVNRLKPAFAIVCGDLINEYPGEQNDTQKRAAQTKDFKETCRKIDKSIPLVCVCGNHDVGNRPTAATIQAYTRDFGDDYFSFWCRGVKCIVVNSQFWKDDTDAAELRRIHDEWLRIELQPPGGCPICLISRLLRCAHKSNQDAVAKKAKHIIAFGHIPLFIHAFDEPDGYFNIDTATRDMLMKEFTDAGCKHYFCGHYHRNAGASAINPATNEKVFEVIVTAACGTNLTTSDKDSPLDIDGIGKDVIGTSVSGVRVVRVQDADIKHTFYTFDDLAQLHASGMQK